MDTQQPEEIRIFFEDLLKDAGVEPESPELKAMMVEDLQQRLQTRFMQILAENLSAEDLETFSTLAEQDPLQANNFLMSKVPNVPQLFLQAMAEFREIYLSA